MGNGNGMKVAIASLSIIAMLVLAMLTWIKSDQSSLRAEVVTANEDVRLRLRMVERSLSSIAASRWSKEDHQTFYRTEFQPVRDIVLGAHRRAAPKLEEAR